MKALVIAIDRSVWFESLSTAGFQRYRDRHALDWEIQSLPLDQIWRCEALAGRSDGPVTIMGKLHDTIIERCRREWPDRRPWFLSTLEAAGADTWTAVVDRAAIGTQAVDHLYDQGYRQIATWGRPTVLARGQVFAGVEQRCRELGVPRTELLTSPDAPTPDAAEAGLLAQIRELPGPVGIVAHQDCDAGFVRTFCATHGLRVPEDVGIVGADDDVSVCERGAPTLSSVRTPWFHLGETLAQTFHQLVAGTAMPAKRQVLLPFGVTPRASTALARASAIDDRLVVRFLSMLDKGATKAISIAAYAKRLGVDRTTLFRRVVRATGRNPQDHLHDHRIAAVCTLLRQTDIPIADIAKRCGYATAGRMRDAFRVRFPVNPGQWRHG